MLAARTAGTAAAANATANSTIREKTAVLGSRGAS